MINKILRYTRIANENVKVKEIKVSRSFISEIEKGKKNLLFKNFSKSKRIILI